MVSALNGSRAEQSCLVGGEVDREIAHPCHRSVDELANFNVDPELFAKLSLQRRPWILASFHLSAWELPSTFRSSAGCAPARERRVPIANCRRHDLESFSHVLTIAAPRLADYGR